MPSHQERGVALVTGGARRLGAASARALHADGLDIVLHHRSSAPEATELAAELNAARPDSATTLSADLAVPAEVDRLAEQALAWRSRMDVLVNNASSFYPTPVGSVTAAQWDDLMATNLRAPFFLVQALAPALRARRGAVVNMVDIYADRPTPEHPVYCAAKAGLVSLTRSLAHDLGPEVRVNGVAPGAIIWPAGGEDDEQRTRTLARIPAGVIGEPEHIARAVAFLAAPESYITGQVLAVDGGRTTQV